MSVSAANLTDTPKAGNAPRSGREHKRENVTVTAITDSWCIRVENEIRAAVIELDFRSHAESLRSRESLEGIECRLTIYEGRSLSGRGVSRLICRGIADVEESLAYLASSPEFSEAWQTLDVSCRGMLILGFDSEREFKEKINIRTSSNI
jgi:hypothetical protein